MPEGVEVRRYADMISKHTKGKLLTDIQILNGRYKTHKEFEGYDLLKSHLPLKLKSSQTKGKLIYLTFTSSKKDKATESEFYLLSTLGLSGGWTFTDVAYQSEAILMSLDDFDMPKVVEYVGAKTLREYHMKTLDHLNVRFEFKGHGELYFFDTLSFGTLKATDDIKILEKKLKELGSDILDDATTAEVFIKQLRKKTHATKAIGNVIVNQKVIAGIGNYLRADGLWMARISPFRKVADLTDSELEKIFKAIKVLVLGDYDIHEGKKQGYITADTKLPTHYKRDFFVYREKTDVDGNPVHKDELFEGSQKRFIFWCPKVQH